MKILTYNFIQIRRKFHGYFEKEKYIGPSHSSWKDEFKPWREFPTISFWAGFRIPLIKGRRLTKPHTLQSITGFGPWLHEFSFPQNFYNFIEVEILS
jgi:hypothetical protein